MAVLFPVKLCIDHGPSLDLYRFTLFFSFVRFTRRALPCRLKWCRFTVETSVRFVSVSHSTYISVTIARTCIPTKD